MTRFSSRVRRCLPLSKPIPQNLSTCGSGKVGACSNDDRKRQLLLRLTNVPCLHCNPSGKRYYCAPPIPIFHFRRQSNPSISSSWTYCYSVLHRNKILSTGGKIFLRRATPLNY